MRDSWPNTTAVRTDSNHSVVALEEDTMNIYRGPDREDQEHPLIRTTFLGGVSLTVWTFGYCVESIQANRMCFQMISPKSVTTSVRAS